MTTTPFEQLTLFDLYDPEGEDWNEEDEDPYGLDDPDWDKLQDCE